MSETPPEFPDVDPTGLAAIIKFAKTYADWVEMDALVAAQHGHDPNSNAVLVAGWRFVAAALAGQL